MKTAFKCGYLSVNGSNNGGAQTHSCDEANVKVLLEDERLHTGGHKEQRRVKKALPVGGSGVVDEEDEQPAWEQKRSEW